MFRIYGKLSYMDMYLVYLFSLVHLKFLLLQMIKNASLVNPFTLRATPESIVCYPHTFENNLGNNRNFTNYLKESCCLASKKHFSIKFFPGYAFWSIIFPKSSGLFWPPWVFMGQVPQGWVYNTFESVTWPDIFSF